MHSTVKKNSFITNQCDKIVRLMSHIPYSFISFTGRFAIAAVFWKSGQTKIEGLAIDLISGDFHLGWPRLTDSAIELFESEYRLPFISPEFAAPLAAFSEHLFPILLLLGFATRFSALALLGMTMIIQLFVYPDAYPTHATWAAILLFIIANGPGKLSVDHWLKNRIK